MNKIVKASINTSPKDNDLLEHMPKALQTMTIIEQRAKARFQEIMDTIEKGETTLEKVKRERGLIQ